MSTQGTQWVKARHQGLVVQSVDDECVVYDKTTDTARLLSPAAAAVWQAARDGATVAALSLVVGEITGATTSLEATWAILSDLDAAGLLEASPAPPQDVASISRRSLLIKLGGAVVAAPFVTTLLAPAAHAGHGCIHFGNACGTGVTGACCGGLTCAGNTCLRASGENCNTHAECASGVCVVQSGPDQCQ